MGSSSAGKGGLVFRGRGNSYDRMGNQGSRLLGGGENGNPTRRPGSRGQSLARERRRGGERRLLGGGKAAVEILRGKEKRDS